MFNNCKHDKCRLFVRELPLWNKKNVIQCLQDMVHYCLVPKNLRSFLSLEIPVYFSFKYLFIYISNICSSIFQISVHLYFKYLFNYISNICSFIFHISVHLYFNYLHIHLYQFIDLSTLYISTMLQATRLRETVRNCLLEGAETGDVWQEVSEKDMWVKRCSL